MAIGINGADGLDKLTTALEESEKKDPAGTPGFGWLLDDQGHRDYLAGVNLMNRK